MTDRLPFDPAKMKAREERLGASPGESSPSREQAITVTALAAIIEGALSRGVPAKVRVIGEVSGFRDRSHWYFDIKDAESVISCVLFQSATKRAGFTPANGQEVVVTGRVDFYAKAGRVTLLVAKIEPLGAE